MLASRIGSLVEIVRDGHNGYFFSPGSVDDLAKKARGLFAATEHLEKLRAGALEAYETFYTRRRTWNYWRVSIETLS